MDRPGRFIWHHAFLMPLLLGALLILAGLRIGVPSLIVLPSRPTVEAVREQTPVSDQEIARLVARSTDALALFRNAEISSNLALGLTLQASQGNDLERLPAAKAALIQSLSEAPANPYAWIRLAVIQASIAPDSPETLTYWRMSALTGPNENRVCLPRIRLGIALWPALTSDDRTVLFSDVRKAWQTDKAFLISLATDVFSTNIIRASLATNVGDLIAFERQLAARQPKK